MRSYIDEEIRSDGTFEKSRTVFCALSGSGVLLHNYETGHYIELTADENAVWLLSDGIHTLQDIAAQLSEGFPESNVKLAQVKTLTNRLVIEKFLVPTAHMDHK